MNTVGQGFLYPYKFSSVSLPKKTEVVDPPVSFKRLYLAVFICAYRDLQKINKQFLKFAEITKEDIENISFWANDDWKLVITFCGLAYLIPKIEQHIKIKYRELIKISSEKTNGFSR